jgi:hypothetical protein
MHIKLRQQHYDGIRTRICSVGGRDDHYASRQDISKEFEQRVYTPCRQLSYLLADNPIDIFEKTAMRL